MLHLYMFTLFICYIDMYYEHNNKTFYYSATGRAKLYLFQNKLKHIQVPSSGAEKNLELSEYGVSCMR